VKILQKVLGGYFLTHTVYASDLRTLSTQNVIVKYVDDTTLGLLVAQHSSVDIDHEYNNVRSWSTQSKLYINTEKIKKLFFTALLLETLFRLLCQELKEVNKQRYLELM